MCSISNLRKAYCNNSKTFCPISSRSNLKECGQLRTLASLESQRLKWADESGDYKVAKEYGNVVNRPIFGYNGDTLVLDILPPPGKNNMKLCYLIINVNISSISDVFVQSNIYFLRKMLLIVF